MQPRCALSARKQTRRREREVGEDGACQRLGKGGAGDLPVCGTLRGAVPFHHALLGEDEPHLGDAALAAAALAAIPAVTMSSADSASVTS